MKVDRTCVMMAKRTMRAAGIDVAPKLLDEIAKTIADACSQERAKLAGMLLGAHDHYGPLSDAQVAVLAQLFEVHVVGDDGSIHAPPGFDETSLRAR